MKILVLAADHDAARTISTSFGLAGHDVSVANDDVSAVNLAMNRPEAVLFDGGDGHAVGLLRDMLGDEPVFVVAGTEDGVAGVDSYVLPPLDLDDTEELLVRLRQERFDANACRNQNVGGSNNEKSDGTFVRKT